MSDNREEITRQGAPPEASMPGMMRATFFRRSPLIILAAALVVLAVIFAPGAQPAAAQQEIVFHHIATLVAKQSSGFLGCAVTIQCSDTNNLSDDDFTYNGRTWTITHLRLLSNGNLGIQMSGSGGASVDELVGLTLRLGFEKTENGETTAEYRSFDMTSTTKATNGFLWLNTGMTWQANSNISVVITSSQPFATLTFGSAAVGEKTYTANAATPKRSLSYDEVLGLKLPMAMGGGYIHTYTATGLPAGLSMSYDLIIRGTPEAATESPATVTYTVTDEANNTDSLTFTVSVAPPVVFDPDEIQTFLGTYREYTVGQTGRINETLPSASGGHGGLTYHLTYVDDTHVERTINDDAPGFSFDAGARVLTSDTGAGAPSEEAVYIVKYRAEDENGAVATAHSRLTVRAAPELPDIDDKSLTVGDAVSITLPKPSGGSLQAKLSMDYTLSPEIEGLTFTSHNFEGTRVRNLSGTPRFAGSTEMTYTVTDANGVSDSETFTITIVNGPSVPTSAPTSVQAGQASSHGAAVAVWGAVAGATEYVVQVIADGGSYPDKPVNSAPDSVSLDFRSTQVVIVGLSDGDYTVRVAARNDDGVGPWSAEVGFTVQIGGV